MKTTIRLLGLMILGLGLVTGCSKKAATTEWSLDQSEASAPLKSFIAAKETQASAALKAEGKDMMPEFKSLFAAAAKGDSQTVSNIFQDLRKRSGQYEGSGPKDDRLRGIAWQAVLETWGVYELFANGADKYMTAFGRDTIDSIPPGSIYFGGTDPGRFVITAMSKSHVNADPFFTLTQNALADGTYLEYLRNMYGGKIYIPTGEDSQKCFSDYMDDAKNRLMHDQRFPDQPKQVKPGEGVQADPASGRIQISGQVAVMAINGLLAKIVFDKNTNQEFYVEESFPLDWMYPHLEPHGLIMKINRQPLSELSDELIQQDRDYWTKYLTPMIGDWLHNDTPVGEVTAFADKVYIRQDFSGLKCDPLFVQSTDAQKMFSKLRSSIAGVYVWRMKHATDASEKQRMAYGADFALRQALALCPYSPETVFRYVDLLVTQNRGADALLVAETAANMPAMKGKDGNTLREVVKQLERYRSAK